MKNVHQKFQIAYYSYAEAKRASKANMIYYNPQVTLCIRSKQPRKMRKKTDRILREIDGLTNTTISNSVPNAIGKLISIFFFSFLIGMYPKPPQRTRFLPILRGCNVL